MGADAETLNRGSIGDVVRARMSSAGRDRSEAETQADLDALRQWTPSPALVDGWRLLGIGCRAREWVSPCGRVKATVWHNAHGKDWRYTVDSPGRESDTVGYPASTREIAQTEALDEARKRLAELDKPAPPSEPSKWHPLAADIAATVAEKNAAYGDSFARSGEVMAILYPNGIAPGQMADALAVVRVIDKLFRIATDRDALGESPWRDIAGYALLACERGGK